MTMAEKLFLLLPDKSEDERWTEEADKGEGAVI